MHITLSYQKPTNNFWIDTGLIVLLKKFGEGQHKIDLILDWLQKQLLQPSGNKGEYYDEQSKTFRSYDKVNWVYPTNLFIKVSGQVKKKTMPVNGKKQKVYLSPPTFKLEIKLSKKPEICDICGDNVPVTNARMWMYPFVVDPQKFGTFYPGAKRGLRLCARCALAGLAGYLGWLWKAQGGNALHVFVFHSELKELKRIHEEILDTLRITDNRGGTARTAFSGPYLHETTLGLLFNLFSHVRSSDLLPPQARRFLARLFGANGETPPKPITLFAITGKPGKAFDMQALREFSKLHLLYRLYDAWTNILVKMSYDKPEEQLTRIFAQFQVQFQSREWETLWRDKIAWAVLDFADPTSFIEQFLFDARAKEANPRPLVRGTLEIFNQYLKEVLKMDEQFLRTLAGFGSALGLAAAQKNEMGLLYALRNAKNPEEFYRVLNDVQFRLEITIPQTLLQIGKGERIAGVPWLRVKTLLAIYAMNAFLRRSAGQEKETAQ